MKTVKFTDAELRALKEIVCNHDACRSGCVYEEMQDSDKDCNECEFAESAFNLIEKLNNLYNGIK